MKAFNYYAPTEIIFGCGRIDEIGEIAARYGKKALLVSGKKSGSLSGVYERIHQALRAAGVESAQFDGVIPNPTTKEITAGADMAKRFGADMIIGVGGGSSMDVAKAVAVEASHPGEAFDYNCHTAGPSDRTLPIIEIATTAGTGSQVTQCAVLTKSENKDKSAIWHRNIFPRVAIVDPETTVSMPKSVTAQTGFDAFCHNFEAYLSVGSSEFVGQLALEAIAIIAQYLPKVLENGADMEARTQMAWADTLGGLTNSNAGVTLPHGLGMQIGGHCPQVTHGQALAAFYPAFTRYTYESAVSKFAAVGRIFDPSLRNVDDKAAAEGCCVALDGFLQKIGLWIDFKSLGVSRQDLREIADCGQVLGDYQNNPRVATIEEMHELLMRCYER